jgi:methyl-accepting chemotaxis protein
MTVISNLKLRNKLLTAPAVVQLCLVIAAVVAFIGLNVQQSSVNEIFNERYTTSLALANIDGSCVRVHGDLFKLISWARANYESSRIDALGAEQMKAMDVIIAELTKMESAAKSDTVKAKFITALAQMRDYKKACSNVIDFATIDLNTATFGMETAQDKYNLLAATLDGLQASDYESSKACFQASTTNYYRVAAVVITVTLAALIISVLLSLYITRLITKPIHALEEAAGKVALGDTSIVLEVSSVDEIGTLTSSFNKMIGNIRTSEQMLLQEKESVERKIEEAVSASEGERAYLNASVTTLLAEMKRFAEGDLTVSVQAEKNDAIGTLFDGFNRAIGNIRTIVLKVAEAVSATASASNQISSSTEEMAAGAHEQTQQASEVAAAVDEMTKTIQETTRNASLASETAKRAGDTAKEGGRVVLETIQGMGRISEVVQKSAQTVVALGRSSDQIGEIVQVIDDIADQTNLLALNAAIEAARAGEQGRGFAVVADEVRKLAERTTKATKEIAQMIRQIQKDTKEAVESMSQGTKEVESGRAMADKAGESLREIISGADTVVVMASEVASTSQEQSAASEQISKNIEAISNVTHESAAGTQQIARAAEDLNRLTQNLEELLQKFTLTYDEGTKPAAMADASRLRSHQAPSMSIVRRSAEL